MLYGLTSAISMSAYTVSTSRFSEVAIDCFTPLMLKYSPTIASENSARLARISTNVKPCCLIISPV